MNRISAIKECFWESVFCIKQSFLQFFSQKDFLKHFIFIYALYFFGYFALITNATLFEDDFFRSSSGYINFHFWNRFSSELLSQILHLSPERNILLAPLLQLLALGVLSLGSMALTWLILGRLSAWGLVGSLFLGLSPFFLTNMAYQFDSLFMAISLVAPLFAFMFCSNLGAFFVTSFIALALTLTTYQAANGVYIVLSLFIAFDMLLKGQSLKNIAKFSSVALLAYIFTFLALAPFFHSSSSEYASTALASFSQIRHFALFNLKSALLQYQAVFSQTIFIYIFIIALFGLILLTLKRTKNRALCLLALFIFLALSTLLSQGAYLLLTKQAFSARTFPAIGVLLAIVFILLLRSSSKAPKALVAITAYALIAESFAFSNAIKEQNEYNKFRLQTAISQLLPLLPENGFDIEFRENIHTARSPVAANSAKTFPIIATEYRNHAAWLLYTTALMRFSTQSCDPLSKQCAPLITPPQSPCKDKNKELIKVVQNPLNRVEIYSNGCFVLEF